jgi:2'-5' RNA ligase
VFYVLAYPEFAPADRGMLRKFRAEFEPERAEMAPPHLTLMFGTRAVAEKQVTELARAAAARVSRFEIVFTERKLVTDPLDATTKLFLLPCEGVAQITQLHDMIYAGLPASELRADIPYAPHMTVATCADARRAQEALTASARLALPLRAWIEAMTVVALADAALRELAAIKFG